MGKFRQHSRGRPRTETREFKKQQGKLIDRYHREVRQALLPIESASILPDIKHESAQSNIVGFSVMHDRRPQYIIVIIDMADTRRKVWPTLEAPKTEFHALVLRGTGRAQR